MSVELDSIDPFQRIHNKLWDYVRAEPVVASRVKPGNMIDRKGDDRFGAKDQRSTADLPQLDLVPRSDATNLVISTDHSEVRQRYNWELSTGDRRPNAVLYPIKFGLLKAMAKAKSEDLDLQFVNDVIVDSSTSDGPRENQLIGDFLMIMSVVVVIKLNTQTELLT